MKKLIELLIVVTVIMCMSTPLCVYAEEEGSEDPAPSAAQTVEENIDSSQPRLMVTEYALDTQSVTPDQESILSITVKNFSKTKAVSNIKLSVSEDSGDIKFSGTGTEFVDRIGTGKSYTWKVKLTAAKTAAIGEHTISFNAEYEDRYYTGYSASDILRVNVRQAVALDYNGIMLPATVVQDDNVSIDMTFMNTGKSKIRNIKVDFSVDHLETAGTVYIGEIEVGANASVTANLRVDADFTGETNGTATVSYEDEFGEVYTTTVDLSATVEQRIEEADFEEEEQPKYPLWWAFLLGGLVIGGGIGAVIPIIIYSNKQRKLDEEML